MAVNMKTTIVFEDVTPYTMVKGHRFGGTACLCLQGGFNRNHHMTLY
jgi:hypothetical protein